MGYGTERKMKDKAYVTRIGMRSANTVVLRTYVRTYDGAVLSLRDDSGTFVTTLFYLQYVLLLVSLVVR